MNILRLCSHKKLHNFLLLLLLPFCLSAQTAERKFQRLKLGLSFNPSINWTHTTGKDMVNYKTPIGFSYGLITDIHFSPNYALGTGFFMDHQGMNLNFYPDSSAPLRHRHRTQNLQIPLTLKLKTNEIGYITYWGQLGVLTSARLAGRSDLNTAFSGDTLEKVSAVPYTRLMNFSLNAGAGIEYAVAEKTSLLFGLEFHNGFANLFKVPEASGGGPATQGTYFNDNRATLSQVVLKVGVLF